MTSTPDDNDANTLAAADIEASSPRWRRLAQLQQFFDRYAWLVPAGSFAVGWIGFFMVQRGADLARWVAVIAIIGWPWLLAEPFVRRFLQRWQNNRLPIIVVNFVSQTIQQELLFFSLPLLIGALQFDVGQIVFAGVTIIAALISTLDPVYERHIAKRPVIRLAFHAWCSWVAALVVLPMVAKVPIERALPLSLIVLIVWIVITIPNLLVAKQSRRQRAIWLIVLLLSPPLLWLARGHIPAAGLSVREAVITRDIDNLVPGAPTKVFASAELPAGVVAFVAIRAPMGVAQSVIFEWCHRPTVFALQRDCERIASEVRGTEGYWRTFSRKRNFPQDAAGKWTVDVLTPQGQLLKRMRFEIR